jgi:hypothetical protein
MISVNGFVWGKLGKPLRHFLNWWTLDIAVARTKLFLPLPEMQKESNPQISRFWRL